MARSRRSVKTRRPACQPMSLMPRNSVFKPGLDGRVAEIGDGHDVFERVLHRGEDHASPHLAPDAAPGFDQSFVQAIELVERLLFPIALADARPKPAGRGTRTTGSPRLPAAPWGCRR